MYTHTDMESVNYFCGGCTTVVKIKPSFLSCVSSLASVFMGLPSIFVAHHKVFFKVAWGVYCSNNRHSDILRFIDFMTSDRVAYLVAVVDEGNRSIFHLSQVSTKDDPRISAKGEVKKIRKALHTIKKEIKEELTQLLWFISYPGLRLGLIIYTSPKYGSLS